MLEAIFMKELFTQLYEYKIYSYYNMYILYMFILKIWSGFPCQFAFRNPYDWDYISKFPHILPCILRETVMRDA